MQHLNIVHYLPKTTSCQEKTDRTRFAIFDKTITTILSIKFFPGQSAERMEDNRSPSAELFHDWES